MSLVFGGAKSDDYQFTEGEIYVPDRCYAMWRPDLDGAGILLREQLGFTPPGALSSDWLTQNQISGTDTLGTTAGFGTTSNATITSSVEQAHGGTKSLKVVLGGVAIDEGFRLVSAGMNYAVNQAAVGQQWYAAVWIYAPLNATLQLEIDERNAAGAYLIHSQTTFTGTGAWQQVTISRTLTSATVAQLDVLVVTRVAAQAITVYADDIELYRTDMTGNAHAAITGAVWVAGPYGRVLRSDGVDDSLKVQGDLLRTGAQSIEALVYIKDWGGGSNGCVIDNGQFFLRVMAWNASFVVSEDAGATETNSDANAITLGTWHHVVIARRLIFTDGTRIYVNGIYKGGGVPGTPVAGRDTYIGNRAAGDKAFDGDIALLRVYNKALTAGEARDAFYEVGPMVGLG